MATMDIREKLVEILKQAPFEGKVLDEWWWEEKIKRIAEHLISNGVTVQEWISVTERLPEDREDVMVSVVFDGKAMIGTGWYVVEKGRWYVRCITTCEQRPDITHWMPLPQPPKGE